MNEVSKVREATNASAHSEMNGNCLPSSKTGKQQDAGIARQLYQPEETMFEAGTLEMKKENEKR